MDHDVRWKCEGRSGAFLMMLARVPGTDIRLPIILASIVLASHACSSSAPTSDLDDSREAFPDLDSGSVAPAPPVVVESSTSNAGSVVRVGAANVLFKYGLVVPSFDTINTTRNDNSSRQIQSLNGSDWKRRELESSDPTPLEPTLAAQFDDSSWPNYVVPRSTRDRRDALRSTVFRKRFQLSAELATSEQINLNFLGCFYRCSIYVNGNFLGEHIGGYNPFSLDVTKFVTRSGVNTLAVSIVGQPYPSDLVSPDVSVRAAAFSSYFGPSGDVESSLHPAFANFSGQVISPDPGLFRDVFLSGHSQIYIPKVIVGSDESGDYFFAVVSNRSEIERRVQLDFASEWDPEAAVADFSLAPGETTAVAFRVVRSDSWQSRWRPGAPVLNRARFKLTDSQEAYVLDQLLVPYGRRWIEVDGTHLRLNGNRIFFKGVNFDDEINDNLTLSRAELESAFFRDFVDLRVNMVRRHTRSSAVDFYELADVHGLAVTEETEFAWMTMNLVGFHRERGISLRFDLLDEMVWHRHNNPSVTIWSLQNEAFHQDGTDTYVAWLTEMRERVRRLDLQKRPVTWSVAAWPNYDPAVHIADIISFNGYFGSRGLDLHPNRINDPQTDPDVDVEAAYARDLENRAYFWTLLSELMPYGKPVVLSECGAYAVGKGGWEQRKVWNTEEYQSDYVSEIWNLLFFNLASENLGNIAGYYEYNLRNSTPKYRDTSWNITVNNGLAYADGTRKIAFSTFASVPVPSWFDYGGFMPSDLTVFNPSDATWNIADSRGGEKLKIRWGAIGDIPLRGDLDGDGRSDLVVYRPSNATFYSIRSSDGLVVETVWGTSGSTPLLADYDGDGRDDIVAFEPASGVFSIARTSLGVGDVSLGQKGDVPVTRYSGPSRL